MPDFGSNIHVNYVVLFSLVFLAVVGAAILLYFDWRRQVNWLKAHPRPQFSAQLIEEICRAMCIADGRNPDGSALAERYGDSPGWDAKLTWHLYRTQALRTIATFEIIDKYKKAQQSDGK
jgi:hypothetical protein